MNRIVYESPVYHDLHIHPHCKHNELCEENVKEKPKCLYLVQCGRSSRKRRIDRQLERPKNKQINKRNVFLVTITGKCF